MNIKTKFLYRFKTYFNPMVILLTVIVAYLLGNNKVLTQKFNIKNSQISPTSIIDNISISSTESTIVLEPTNKISVNPTENSTIFPTKNAGFSCLRI